MARSSSATRAAKRVTSTFGTAGHRAAMVAAYKGRFRNTSPISARLAPGTPPQLARAGPHAPCRSLAPDCAGAVTLTPPDDTTLPPHSDRPRAPPSLPGQRLPPTLRSDPYTAPAPLVPTGASELSRPPDPRLTPAVQ